MENKCDHLDIVSGYCDFFQEYCEDFLHCIGYYEDED